FTTSRPADGSPNETFEMPSTVLHLGSASLMARTASIVSTALPVYAASPEAQGKTSGSKYRSSSGTPYLLVSSSYGVPEEDRKSTRLNSSHRTTSYAAFSLKKKTMPML